MTLMHDVPPTRSPVVETAIDRAVDRDDEFRAPRRNMRLLRIPAHRFVMLDGAGPPDPRAFEARMPGLYGVAYPIRFAMKDRGVVTKVGPLEGLWWTTDPDQGLDTNLGGGRDDWRWTLMIALPDEANQSEIEEYLAAGRAKLAADLADAIRIETFDEGIVAQLMHIGPYAEERPAIERMHEQIAAVGLRPRGRHHELYLGDPRRCAPDRLRTIVRQPVM